ncbi:hypothetical protein CspeluHIS016_0502630 [Cutaneotrichosporon spelunceum]|uniref:Uncharacterized protein n=1 Tax=Cutaneotrichosporon spelunceum TaxID=1672016 RepID=A0AAD3TX82_9TREE|nr:hypothetical protein CspeluHIS016_0502630 [Cutaneotrichosporon spelunceum]
MPYVSTEALVGAALVVVLAFGYQQMTSTGSHNDNNSSSTASKKKSKKNKKKKTGADTPVDTPVVLSEAEEPKSEPKKGKKGKPLTLVKQEIKPLPTTIPTPAVGATPEESEEIESPSFAAATRTRTKPKTLAEKLVPKPRKTKVDDMLEPEDRPPQLARVMRVVQPEKIQKYADDYASSEWSDEPRQDDGWNVVAAKKKPVSVSIGGGGSGSSPARPKASVNEPLTKLQRKNQKKSEAKRAAKEVEEADRLRRLALHKKDLEREKINAVYNTQQKKVVRERGRVVEGGSGGQGATLNHKGQLVWD